MTDHVSVSSPVKVGDEEFTEGEILVYLGEGARRVTIKHPDFFPFEYKFWAPLKGKQTYELRLKVPDSYVSSAFDDKEAERIKTQLDLADKYWEDGDSVKALEIYHQFSDEPDAQYHIGLSYENEGKYTDAFRWYKLAAEKDHPEAQNSLATLYDDGKGVGVDKYEATQWFRRAAQNGNPKAQFNVGTIYYNGDGAPQDYAEAKKWYIKAADQGDADAQFNLGLIFKEGLGVPKDYGEAIKWFRKAAEQGVAEAQFLIGYMYEKGIEVTKDKTEAIKWYKLAADQGYEDAIKALENSINKTLGSER